MTALEARGRALGGAVRTRLAERVRSAVAALPGVEASVEGDHIVLTGRGLERRMSSDPALRWVGGLLK